MIKIHFIIPKSYYCYYCFINRTHYYYIAITTAKIIKVPYSIIFAAITIFFFPSQFTRNLALL